MVNIMATKEENVAAVVILAEAKNKAKIIEQGNSEEVADAYAVINRNQVINAVTQIYDLIEEAGLLK